MNQTSTILAKQLNRKELWLKYFTLLISITCLSYIIYMCWNNMDALKKIPLTINQPHLILIVITLMPFNWFLEVIKWKILVSPLQEVAFPKASSAVLVGLSLAMFTPNRIGEFGGRIMFLDKGNRLQGIWCTWIGSLMQLFATVLFGLIGFIALSYQSHSFTQYYSKYLNYIWIIIGVITLAAFLLFFRKRIIRFIKKKWTKLYEYFNFIQSYKLKSLLLIFSLSIFRYAVFSFQYYLMCRVFNIQGPFALIISGIFVVYFISSLIPSVTLIEFGIRGSVAIFIFSLLGVNNMEILGATTSLWFVNIAIPALVGTSLMHKIRW